MPSIPASVPRVSVTISRVAPFATGPPASGSSAGSRTMRAFACVIFIVSLAKGKYNSSHRVHRGSTARSHAGCGSSAGRLHRVTVVIPSEHHLPAIRLQCLAGDETGARSAQETHGARDLIGFAIASERNIGWRRTGCAARSTRRVHSSGRYAVGAHTAIPKLTRERACHADETVFCDRA